MGARIAIAVAMLTAMTLILVLYLPAMRPQPPTVSGQTASTGTVSIGGPFTLVDGKGSTVTDADLKGRYSLIFFGFTHCPDICPLTLQIITQALDEAGAAADAVQPVFISVDPERDTPDAMAAYVANFHPRLMGLTGTAEQVQGAVKSYKAYAAKGAAEKDAAGNPTANYTVTHTGYIYLMDRAGQYITHFDKDATAEIIAARLRQLDK